MSHKIEITPTKKDYYNLVIDGIEFPKWERSELRDLLQKIDNEI